jgi:RNA polymerase sigma-70 factor (ECF subfamily)
MEKRHLYREQSSLKAWLFTIATNTLRDEIKAANKLISLEYQQLESLQTVELETENNLLKSYNHALLQLPFKQRESFILQQEGFSLAQIASITSEPQETVKTRLRYAKQQLKISLGVYNEI